MFITNNPDCTSEGNWEPYTTTKTWQIAQTNNLATVYAKFRDAEKNESNCISRSVTHDNTPPAAPNGISLVSPRTTPSNIITPTIKVAGLTKGDTVSIHTDTACQSNPIVYKVAIDTTMSLTVSGIRNDGTYNFYAKSTDSLGNTSNCSTVKLSYIFDSTPPSSPSISINNNDEYTNSTTVKLLFSASEIPAQTYLTQVAGCTSGGVWTAFISNKPYILPRNSRTASVYAKFRDAAGNISPCVSASINIDTIPPYAPDDLTLITPASSTGIGQSRTPIIRIKGVSVGDTISIHTDSQCSDASQKGSKIADGTSIDVTASTLSTDGPYMFYAKATDRAKNNKCSRKKIIYTLKTNVPTVTITSPTDGSVINAKSRVSAFALSGTCSEALLPVTLNVTGGATASTICRSGKWSGTMNLTSAPDGSSVTITANHSDTAGNKASPASVRIIKDLIPPYAVAIKTPTARSFVNSMNQESFVIDGICSESGTKNITLLSGSTALITTDCFNGKFRQPLNLSSIPDGRIILSAVLSDLAKNSLTSQMIQITKDTLSPIAESITIADGAASTTSTSVALALSASATPSAMYITNVPGCLTGGSWKMYSTTKTGWKIELGTGISTVFVKFRDLAGNESTCINDEINSPSPSPSKITQISWTANKETAVNSAGGGYKVYYSQTAGFNVQTASFVNVPYQSGSATPNSVQLTNLTAGTWYFRVVAYSSLNGGSQSAPSAEISLVVNR